MPREASSPASPLALPGPLVGVDWLAARLGAPGLVVLDASLAAHRGTRRRIPGALPFDLDGALSDHSAPLPHTMPAPDDFAAALRSLGIDDADTLIVYDGAGIYSSARAWWMLRAVGFDRAAVLDGGLPAWTAAGLPTEAIGDEPAGAGGELDGRVRQQVGRRGDFTARVRPGLFVGSGEVSATLADPEGAVVDARSRERFAGTAAEPRPGLRGGHMPGAWNLPFGELQQDGRMLPAPALRAAFAGLVGQPRRLVLSCGSGVTACVLALGAVLAGYREVSVYDGSWSEWGLPSALPVVGPDEAGAPPVGAI